jgi:hypothetical protein
MAITVRRIPEQLTWADYLPIPLVINPYDSTEQDALTAFKFYISEEPNRTIDGQLALAEALEIIIKPHARAKLSGRQTAEFLIHEQFHYDVGFVVARVVARELMLLRAEDETALNEAVWNILRLHFFFRAELIQRRYDLDTRHGTIRYDQQVWFSRMARCLADPASSQIGGFWL